MAEVLSQSQIDALLSAMNSGEGELNPPQEEKPEKKYRKYDFSSPRKFTKDRIKMLMSIFENYARVIIVPGQRGVALRIEPLAQLNVGKSERLLVVRLGSRCLLLGVTAGGISPLAELTEEEVAQWQAQAEGNPRPSSFAELLDGIQKRKKQG